MKLNLIAAAVLTAAAFGAHASVAQLSFDGGTTFATAAQAGTAADPYLLGVLTAAGAIVLRHTGLTSTFTEYATFSLTSPHTGINGGSLELGMTGFSAKLYKGAIGSGTLVPTVGNPYSLTGLSTGSYFLKVTGAGTGAGSFYAAGVSATPVPEPETYALMAAGLAVIGFVAKRRKSA